MAGRLLTLWVFLLAAYGTVRYAMALGGLLVGRGAHLPWPWPWVVVLTVVTFVLGVESPEVRGVPARSRAAWRFLAWGHVVAPGVLILAPLLGRDGPVLLWVALVGFGEAALGRWIWPSVRGVIRRLDPGGVRVGRRKDIARLPVEIGAQERFLHVHVLGPTGSGKTSSVLLPLLAQDLDRPRIGVTVIDPKGDLYRGALALCQRSGRTPLRFSPLEGESLTLNPLAGEREAVAEGLAYALGRSFTGGHPFYDTLAQGVVRASVLALKEVRGEATDLEELARFLGDDDFRAEILHRSEDAVVRGYFRDQVQRWSAQERTRNLAGIQSQLLGLLANPDLRRCLTGPGTLDLDRALATAQVVLCHLPVESLGAGAHAAGAFFLMQWQLAVFRRGASRAPQFLYADEFQGYATPGFGEFLAQGRSFQAGAVLSHQHLGQLDGELMQAVLANARNRVLLGGLSGADIARLEDTLGTEPAWREVLDARGAVRSRTRVERPRILPTELRELPRGEAVCQLVENGRLTPPRRVRLPLVET